MTSKPRPEFLDLAQTCGAALTGKPDGSEAITVVFTIKAWQAFDAALAQPAASGEPAEPVAWAQLGLRNGHTYVRMHYEGHLYPPPPDVQRNLNLVPLYAAPQPAPARVPLTDEQAMEIAVTATPPGSMASRHQIVKAIRLAERHHGIFPSKENPL